MVSELDRSGLGDCCGAGLSERVLPTEELAERERSCEVPPGALGLHVKEMSGEGGVVGDDDEDEGHASTESYILTRDHGALPFSHSGPLSCPLPCSTWSETLQMLCAQRRRTAEFVPACVVGKK